MRKWLGIICALCLQLTWATEVKTLYQAAVPIQSQSDQDRLAAQSAAMQQVLIKLTGDNKVLANPVIVTALKQPEHYVQEFSYTTAADNDDAYYLSVNFSPKDIKQLLKSAGVVYWGANRPLVMVWATLEDKAGDNAIISNETHNQWVETLKNQANQVGLPLLFPVMDVDDLKQVSVTDVNTPVLPVIKEASKRYAPDALLIGSITPSAGRYVSQWLMIWQNDQWHWVLSGASLQEVAMALAYQVNHTLARQFVPQTEAATPETWINLQVTQLTEQNDLVSLLDYLKHIALVHKVELLEIDGQVAEVRVLVEGKIDKFLENATIGKHLEYKSQIDEDSFSFEWMH